jgi:hypothetical protein
VDGGVRRLSYNRDFSAEEVFDFGCFDGIWTLVRDELVKVYGKDILGAWHVRLMPMPDADGAAACQVNKQGLDRVVRPLSPAPVAPPGIGVLTNQAYLCKYILYINYFWTY